MTVRWNIDEQASLTTVTIVGQLNFEVARATILELHEQPAYRPPMLDLWDLRDATLVAGPGDVLAFVRFVGDRRRELSAERGTERTALVVSGALGFGLSRMYQAHAELSLPLAIGVFRAVDEARSWLGVAGARSDSD